ncbi:MAG: glutamate--tRNA ligase [Candidatus Jidaibacter sp.]|jgi:glutamyl-tRNA synthetase|nr:glutamate--tRNA ligase [Candidatus Jidaibacter sp.]
MTVITRFAPSPTGYLHVGNIRTALVNWLFARKNNGKFILRIDDTDMTRSKPEYTKAIMEDLTWLGLTWDAIYYQSERMDLYEDSKKELINSKRLYPCFESPEELEIKKKVMLNKNLPPIYDRASLNLSDDEVQDNIAEGNHAHYRFKLNDEMITWEDGIRGSIHFDPKNISDPVLVRADGTMTYMIATVIDDIKLGITDIIRGEDHITNSAVHVQMFKAFGANPPHLNHLSLIKSTSGEISKRLGGFDIRSLRAAGIHPMAINSFLMKLGSSDPIEYRKTLDDLVADFDISKYGKASTNYDIAELERINTKLVHNLSYYEAKSYLSSKIDETFWERVKHNLSRVNEAEEWWNICCDEIEPQIQDLQFTSSVAKLLPEGSWDENTWNTWIHAIKHETGKSGKELFMPIRHALTALEHGPELKHVLPIIGREKAVKRLSGQKA